MILKTAIVFSSLLVSVASFAQTAAQPGGFRITSESIVDGNIAKVHACNRQGGENKSPHIQISNVPDDAKYLAIIMDDPDAQPVAGKTWVHWNVFNIPATVATVSVGVPPEGEVKNSSRSGGYEGMCPPNGVHTYRIAVFAMKERIDAGGIFGISPIIMEDFEKKFNGVIAQKFVLKGKF